MKYPYVLVYNKPERNFVWANGFITKEEAEKHLTNYVLMGRNIMHFSIVENVDPQVIVLELTFNKDSQND